MIGPAPARLLGGALAALLVALPAPIAAQYGPPPPPPPRDLPPASSSTRTEAVVEAPQAELLRAASCLIDRDAEAGTPLLGSAPYSREEREHAQRALRAGERCLRLRRPIASTALLLRGAMAESLYETRFADPATPRDPPAATAPLFRPEAATSRDDAGSLAPSFAMAECAAAREPATVRALLASDPATDSESAALQLLNPVFVQCVTAGTSLNVDRASIRAILAESLYRWSVVQRDGPASSWAAAAPAPAN